MKQLLTIICFFFINHLFAQTAGSIVVHKDPRIDSLIKKQIEINEITTRDARRFTEGYRILIISTNNRDKAIDAKATVFQNFPGLKTYFVYQAPYFKVKVGNFKEREDAEAYLPNIQKVFPTGVYIIHDIIEQDFGKSDDTEQ